MSIQLSSIKKPKNSKLIEDSIRNKCKELFNIKITPNTQINKHVHMTAMDDVNSNNNSNTLSASVLNKYRKLNNNNINLSSNKVVNLEVSYNQSVKVITHIPHNYLFHYAHFVCDFLFPFVCKGYHKYKEIIREKNLNQTIGVFGDMFKEIIGKNYTELPAIEYKQNHSAELNIIPKENLKATDFLFFQNFMWEKYKVKSNIGIWPEVVLIKRSTQTLLNIDEFETAGQGVYRLQNGAERRDIIDFAKIQTELTKKFPGKMETISLENTTFEYQVNLFYHAKIIIAAHGAALTNLFFCKPETIIIEIKSISWPFFNTISNQLQLRHIICENNFNSIQQITDTLIL